MKLPFWSLAPQYFTRFFFLQIHMLNGDISKIQLELVPMVQEIITEWHIIHFLGTTPSESPAAEDFSSQLSSLQIGWLILVLVDKL